MREGEIVAITGVAGNGQHSLVEALFGLSKLTSGHISILGRDVGECKPRDLVLLNVGRIPENRQTTGLALGLSVRENLVLETYFQAAYYRLGVLRQHEINRLAWQLGEEYNIRMPSINLLTGKLSGSNQQKVILARAMHRDPPRPHPTRRALHVPAGHPG